MRKISLIIPIYNEELHLQKFLEELDSHDLGIKKELVIVDDCSTDRTSSIIEKFKFESEYKFYKQQVNQGKGAALRLGISHATGDVIGIQDADFEYDIQDIARVIAPLIDGRFDVIYGSRFKKGGTQVHRTFHYLINRLLSTLSNICSGLYLSDMETCYKFFKAEVIKNIELESNRFGFEPEVTAKIARLKLRVGEIPISYYPRSYIEGKKICWRDGVAALWHIVYFNFLISPNKSFKNLPRRYLANKYQWL